MRAPRPAPPRRGHVDDEDRDEHHGVERRDRVLERQGQRVDRRDGQERELHRVRPVERDALPPVARSAHPSRRRIRYQATNTTIDQPMPISSRLAPVMLASASPHGDSFHAPGRRKAGRPGRLERVPALPREDEVDRVLGQHRDQRQHGDGEAGEMSSWAASAAQARRNAAPTMARPKSAASTGCGSPERRSERPARARRRRPPARARCVVVTGGCRWVLGPTTVSSSLRPKVSSPVGGGSPGRDARP